jgi:hypothetical protein
MPAGNGPLTNLAETPGSSVGFDVHNSTVPKYEQQRATVTVVANTYAVARTRAVAARNALGAVKNQTVGSTWYLRITTTPVYDMGLDDKDRPRCVFNVWATKRPS